MASQAVDYVILMTLVYIDSGKSIRQDCSMFHAGSCLYSGLSLALMAQSGSMHLSTHSIARCGNDVIRLDTSGAHPIDMLHISKVISTHPHRVFLHLGQVGARPIQPSLNRS